MEIFHGYDCEISILLLSLLECCTPSESLDDNKVLVNFVTKVLLKVAKDETKFNSEWKTSLEQRYSSLKEILCKLS